jgi:hypothetical protein
MNSVIKFDIKKIQERKDTKAPFVQLPKGLFTKGEDVLITAFDSDTAIVTRRIPPRGKIF